MTNWKILVGKLVFNQIFGYLMYLSDKEATTITIYTATVTSLDLISFFYDKEMSDRRSKQKKYPEIDVNLAREKPRRRNFIELIRNENRVWVKISFIVLLSILSRIITSKWYLSGFIFLDYVLFECREFLKITYNQLFPSIGIFACLLMRRPITNSRGWSKLVTILVALLINAIDFSLVFSMLVISINVILFCILCEMIKFLTFIINCENDKSSLSYTVLEIMTVVFNDYYPYFVCFISAISWCMIRYMCLFDII